MMKAHESEVNESEVRFMIKKQACLQQIQTNPLLVDGLRRWVKNVLEGKYNLLL
jgi:hypothetical protein